MRITVAVIIALATATAVVLAAYGFLSRDTAGLLDPGNASVVARGEAIYVERCASCHGKNLEGQPDWQTPTRMG